MKGVREITDNIERVNKVDSCQVGLGNFSKGGTMNWLEFLDKRACPAMRKLAQRCSKYKVRCASWVKRKDRPKKRTY